METAAHIDNTRLKPNPPRGEHNLSDAKAKLKRVQREAKLDGEDEGYLTDEDVERVFELYEQFSQIHDSCTVTAAAEGADRLTELTFDGYRVRASRKDLEGDHYERSTGLYVDFDFRKAEDEEAYEEIKEIGFSSSAKRKYIDETIGTNDYPHDAREIEEIREERKRERQREERERQRRIEQSQFEDAEYVAKLHGLHREYRFNRTFLDANEGGYYMTDDSIYEVKHEEGNRTYLMNGEEVTDDEIEAHFEENDDQERRSCWECGQKFTRAEIKDRRDGEWNSGVGRMCYCGC
jgi:hypothetical protein